LEDIPDSWHLGEKAFTPASLQFNYEMWNAESDNSASARFVERLEFAGLRLALKGSQVAEWRGHSR